jgi:SAM-dependent methyltransferase
MMYVLIAVFVYSRFQQDRDDDAPWKNTAASISHTIHKGDPNMEQKKESLLSLINDADTINNSNSSDSSNNNITTTTTTNNNNNNNNNNNKTSPKEVTDNHSYQFPESANAHQFLDDRLGIEIAASADHGFGLSTINIDIEDSSFQSQQVKLAGVYRRIDVLAPAHQLPLDTASVEFVLANHVLQQVEDPIGVLCEWGRVVQDGGFLYIIVPSKQHAFWHRDKPATNLKELIERHKIDHQQHQQQQHGGDLFIWAEHDALEFLWYMGVKIVDSKEEHDSVKGGISFVIQVMRQNGMFSSRCTI